MQRASACPDCGAVLPTVDGPTHRYLGASPACWSTFSALNNAGVPPLAPGPLIPLITDAYAVQHPGSPSPQAIQSVAVHLLAMYGVLERGFEPDRALDMRVRALQHGSTPKRDRFHWLTPPDAEYSLTIAHVADGETPRLRTETSEQWIHHVWEVWSVHRSQAAEWFRRYVYGGPRRTK